MNNQPDLFGTNESSRPSAPSASPVRQEKARLNAAALRVLEHLKAHGSALNHQLCTKEIGGNGGIRRVWELTQDGWDIRKAHVSGGTYRYTLHGLKR